MMYTGGIPQEIFHQYQAMRQAVDFQTIGSSNNDQQHHHGPGRKRSDDKNGDVKLKPGQEQGKGKLCGISSVWL